MAAHISLCTRCNYDWAWPEPEGGVCPFCGREIDIFIQGGDPGRPRSGDPSAFGAPTPPAPQPAAPARPLGAPASATDAAAAEAAALGQDPRTWTPMVDYADNLLSPATGLSAAMAAEPVFALPSTLPRALAPGEGEGPPRGGGRPAAEPSLATAPGTPPAALAHAASLDVAGVPRPQAEARPRAPTRQPRRPPRHHLPEIEMAMEELRVNPDFMHAFLELWRTWRRPAPPRHLGGHEVSREPPAELPPPADTARRIEALAIMVLGLPPVGVQVADHLYGRIDRGVQGRLFYSALCLGLYVPLLGWRRRHVRRYTRARLRATRLHADAAHRELRLALRAFDGSTQTWHLHPRYRQALRHPASHTSTARVVPLRMWVYADDVVVLGGREILQGLFTTQATLPKRNRRSSFSPEQRIFLLRRI